MLKLFIALQFIGTVAFSEGKSVQTKPRLGVRIKVNQMIPGQPDVGAKEVEIKLNHFLKPFGIDLDEFLRRRHADPVDDIVQEVLTSVHFKKFLSTRNIQVVRDPRGRFQIFDGHHLALALHLLEIDEIDVDLHEDFFEPNISPARLQSKIKEYQEYMIEHQMIRLEDQMGRKITFEDLPLNVDDMVDNPFRSLAWLLKKAKTYKDLDVPFQEFAWASFLRTEFAKHRWPLNFRSDQQYMSAVEHSMTVIFDEKNLEKLEELPGFKELPTKDKKIDARKEKLLSRCEKLLFEHELTEPEP